VPERVPVRQRPPPYPPNVVPFQGKQRGRDGIHKLSEAEKAALRGWRDYDNQGVGVISCHPKWQKLELQPGLPRGKAVNRFVFCLKPPGLPVETESVSHGAAERQIAFRLADFVQKFNLEVRLLPPVIAELAHFRMVDPLANLEGSRVPVYLAEGTGHLPDCALGLWGPARLIWETIKHAGCDYTWATRIGKCRNASE